MRAKFLTVCVALAAAAPLAASAEDAFTAGFTDVFAGPSSDYPPIAQLPPNTEVRLAGCLSDWSWCDIVVGPNHGWVYAGDLVVPYQGQRLVILQYGPRYHFVPVVTFSLVAYWDRYYRSRPFYAERNVWVNRVHIAAGHGGRAPAGHEAAARQTAPVQAQAPAPSNGPNARAAEGERARAAQNEKARTDEADRTRASQNDRARTFQQERSPPPQAASKAEQAQRPQTAQAPRNEQPRQEQRKAAEPQQAPHTAQVERPREAQPQRAEPKQQEARTEAAPRESRNAPREETRNAPREEKKDGKEG